MEMVALYREMAIFFSSKRIRSDVFVLNQSNVHEREWTVFRSCVRLLQFGKLFIVLQGLAKWTIRVMNVDADKITSGQRICLIIVLNWLCECVNV